ncbi:5-formyltetrahydrofolate cyclo-ligase [Asticcacaulis biprosthecium C19]|uniref:5-formyltetrahydrofolate cyclo-ligase n=1 Tax=Asticcacaulis biprosthecium C19 TaxID=715226 RepID=F4QHA9_9CAUL|nr:5-formyltetrahydrofolate cyclo-ligase [Asticcacaulis biprosthecium]EGF92646.1 5-formyltetrahydrofolate cyclo-ligase [Asticcacaulis biprosthecium C19]
MMEPDCMTMADPKPLLRAEMKRRRAQLAAANPLAGEQVGGRAEDAFEAWPSQGGVIAGYWPIQSEINPFPLMQMFEDRGYQLALPALVPVDGGYRMIFRMFRIGDDLIDGPFDIRQPSDDAQTVDPDLLLMPLLAFDADGIRLGYGGGYYDRALADLRSRCKVAAWGVAFSGQQLAETPSEAHDQPLNGIFTETGVIGMNP